MQDDLEERILLLLCSDNDRFESFSVFMIKNEHNASPYNKVIPLKKNEHKER